MAALAVAVARPELGARMATGALVVVLGPQGMAAMAWLAPMAPPGVTGAMAVTLVLLGLAEQLAQVSARPALLGLPVRR